MSLRSCKAVAEGPALETHVESFKLALYDDDEEFISLICEMEAEADENNLDSRRRGESAPGKSRNKKRGFDGTMLKLRKHNFGFDGMSPVYDKTTPTSTGVLEHRAVFRQTVLRTECAGGIYP